MKSHFVTLTALLLLITCKLTYWSPWKALFTYVAYPWYYYYHFKFLVIECHQLWWYIIIIIIIITVIIVVVVIVVYSVTVCYFFSSLKGAAGGPAYERSFRWKLGQFRHLCQVVFCVVDVVFMLLMVNFPCGNCHSSP